MNATSIWTPFRRGGWSLLLALAPGVLQANDFSLTNESFSIVSLHGASPGDRFEPLVMYLAPGETYPLPARGEGAHRIQVLDQENQVAGVLEFVPSGSAQGAGAGAPAAGWMRLLENPGAAQDSAVVLRRRAGQGFAIYQASGVDGPEDGGPDALAEGWEATLGAPAPRPAPAGTPGPGRPQPRQNPAHPRHRSAPAGTPGPGRLPTLTPLDIEALLPGLQAPDAAVDAAPRPSAPPPASGGGLGAGAVPLGSPSLGPTRPGRAASEGPALRIRSDRTSLSWTEEVRFTAEVEDATVPSGWSPAPEAIWHLSHPLGGEPVAMPEGRVDSVVLALVLPHIPSLSGADLAPAIVRAELPGSHRSAQIQVMLPNPSGAGAPEPDAAPASPDASEGAAASTGTASPAGMSTASGASAWPTRPPAPTRGPAPAAAGTHLPGQAVAVQPTPKRSRPEAGGGTAATGAKRHAGAVAKPFECEFCGRGFSQNFILKAHRRTHTGETPFSCEHCGKGFSVKSNLRVHRRIHTGEKPFRCETCDRSFTQSSNWRSHLKRGCKGPGTVPKPLATEPPPAGGRSGGGS